MTGILFESHMECFLSLKRLCAIAHDLSEAQNFTWSLCNEPVLLIAGPYAKKDIDGILGLKRGCTQLL